MKLFLKLAALGGILFLSLLTATAVKIHQYAQGPFMPVKADFAIVLGAKTHREKPTRAFQERIDHGIELYRQGWVQKLIFTGKPGNPPQALVAKKLALEAGIPEADILTETYSLRTMDNLRHAKDLVSDADNRSFLIVTDPLHLKRAMEMAQDLGIKAFPSPTNFMRERNFYRRMKILAYESFAYVKYRVRRFF